MKIRIRFLIIVLEVIIMLPAIVIGSDFRILVARDQFWKLSELDWSLVEVSEDFDPITKHSAIFSLDFAKQNGVNNTSFLGLEVLEDSQREIVTSNLENGEVLGQFSGSRPGFNFTEKKVGFLRINPAEIEDAFYLSAFDGSKLKLICSGGFYEHYPVVSSPSYFYVFRSDANQTLRVTSDGDQVDKPSFLESRIVLAVWGDDKLFLVHDRKTKEYLVLDNVGEIISVIEIEKPHAAIEFSSDGRLVYVSIAKTVNGVEIVDFSTYNIESGGVHIIQENFSVGIGEMNRYKGE